jgi:hypothetical protein
MARTQVVEWRDFEGSFEEFVEKCNRYGQVGDRLWVKESWRFAGWGPYDIDIQYRRDMHIRKGIKVPEDFSDASLERYLIQCEEDCVAAGLDQFDEHGNYTFGDDIPTRWRGGRFMPKWASRLILEVVEPVRVERLQDITEEDCTLEGLVKLPLSQEAIKRMAQGYWVPIFPLTVEYAYLWDKLNTQKGLRWRDNPWISVHTFRMCDE